MQTNQILLCSLLLTERNFTEDVLPAGDSVCDSSGHVRAHLGGKRRGRSQWSPTRHLAVPPARSHGLEGVALQLQRPGLKFSLTPHRRTGRQKYGHKQP